MAEKGCGFYGYSTCSKCHREFYGSWTCSKLCNRELVKDSMCAKCYVEVVRREFLSKYEGKPTVVPPGCLFPFAHPAFRSSSSVVSQDSSEVKINRCQSCNKKVGLMGFSCRCGKVFCGLHRYPIDHSCKFDFKTADRLILAKQNPVIKPDKLESRV